MAWRDQIKPHPAASLFPLLSPDELQELSEDIKKFARDNLSKRLGWLDGALGSKNFLMGDTFTVADAYLFVVLSWAGHVHIDLGQWPNLKRFHDSIAKRPSVIAAEKAEGIIK